jgi:23S rRNA (guanosine2251-2'-O)-methyltransferase
MDLIAGIHPVREALKAGRPLERICLVKDARSPRLDEIATLARKAHIPVRLESRESLDRMTRSIPHQGVVAIGSAARHSQLEDFLEGDGMLVVLDGVEDPHNLGAIVRTAHAAGAKAVLIGERRSAPLSETAAKAAAGALSLLPVIKVANLNRAIEKLKESRWWIYGLDERGQATHWETRFEPRSVLVLGGEGHGLHEHVRSKCDFLLRIPMAGAVASLNVSVAAGVALFEWRRATGMPE